MTATSERARPPTTARFCARCGAPAIAGGRFCRSCGFELASGVAAPAPPAAGPATAARRVAAVALDVLLLAGGFALALGTGIGIGQSPAVLWALAAIWVFLLGPLYFALYHAFGGPGGGPGATPGQHELRLDVRDGVSAVRPSLRAALLRSYAGLAAGLLVVPLMADWLKALSDERRRSWRDRRWGTEVWFSPTATATATATSVLQSGEYLPCTHLLRRAWNVLRQHGRQVLTPTLLTYLGFAALAAILVPLSLGDTSATADVGTWFMLSIALFTSGIYWTQAMVVSAVESIRRGRDVRAVETVREAVEHVNALSAALVLLLAMLYPLLSVVVFVFPVLLLSRLTLVVPALMLEDRRVLESFGRSWSLTEGRTWLVSGLAVLSVAALLVVIAACTLVGTAMTAGLSSSGAMRDGLAIAAAMLLASVPVSALNAWLGTAWCVLYYDLRGEDAR